MIYIWANREVYVLLKDENFKELKSTTDDRECFKVNVKKKEFRVVHKHHTRKILSSAMGGKQGLQKLKMIFSKEMRKIK